MPLATIYAITDDWIFGKFSSHKFETQQKKGFYNKNWKFLGHSVCLIWLSADYIASTASILNLLTLSLDRYLAITSPLQSLSTRTKTCALTMISLAWFISLLWVLPITSWSHFIPNDHIIILNNSLINDDKQLEHRDDPRRYHHHQPQKCIPDYDKNIYFKLGTVILNFYVPLLALIALNMRIYWAIYKSSRHDRREGQIRKSYRNNKQEKAFRYVKYFFVTVYSITWINY